MKFVVDSFFYRGNTLAHDATGVLLEFSCIAAFAVILWGIS